MALFHQRQQHLQKEQMLNQQSQFYTQALQYQVNQQAKIQQAKLQAAANFQQQQAALVQQQQRQLVESHSLESDNSEEMKRYDDIEDWEIPSKDLILKINQQVMHHLSVIETNFNIFIVRLDQPGNWTRSFDSR